jgi:hypothetical protein
VTLALTAGPSAARYAAEVNVAAGVPNIDVYAETGRSATQTYFHAADIFAGFELQVTDIGDVYSSDKVIVFLLLFTDSAR